jgi:hypothetical protein
LLTRLMIFCDYLSAGGSGGSGGNG